MKDGADLDRRSLLRLTGATLGLGALWRFAPGGPGGAALADALGRANGEAPAPFRFVQLSDTHVGYEGPNNPLGTKAFERALDEIAAMPAPPDLVLVTGDLTHDTEKPGEHAKRMALFKTLAGRLRDTKLVTVPGEHDAGLDGGALFREHFGETHRSFDHKGVHFVALDNVSLGKPKVGDEQLAWLKKDLGRFPDTAPVVVLTHRPLFDLAPEWEWFTGDGDAVLAELTRFKSATVLYGHIHRRHVKDDGAVRQYAARSLIFAFPDPASTAQKKPIAFDAARPFANLGLRRLTRGNGSPPLTVDDVELTSVEHAGTVGMKQMLKGVRA